MIKKWPSATFFVVTLINVGIGAYNSRNNFLQNSPQNDKISVEGSENNGTIAPYDATIYGSKI